MKHLPNYAQNSNPRFSSLEVAMLKVKVDVKAEDGRD